MRTSPRKAFVVGLAITFAGCGGCGTVVAGSGEEKEPHVDGGGDAGYPGLETFAQTPTQGSVISIAHDAENIFWMENDPSGMREVYRIKRAPISGGDAAVLLEFDAQVEGLRRVANGLTLWAGELFWILSPGDFSCAIHAIPIDGGAQRLVFQKAGECSEPLLAAEDGLWYGAFGPDTTKGSMFRLPWGTLTPSLVVWAENTVSVPWAFALTPRQVTFVTGEPSIFTGPRQGESAQAHRIKVGGYADQVATDGWRTYVAASGQGTDRGFIIDVPELGEEHTVYVGPLHSNINALAANSKYVFFVEDGMLRRMDAGGSLPKDLFGGLILKLHATERHLYFTELDGIRRIPVD